ncbi:fimbria/pilus periplasmic chaperone [Cupriavidus campinensis]
MLKKAIKSILFTGACALALTSVLPAQAAIVLAATRVIYHAKDAEATIKLSNEGGIPMLAQAWLDKGDVKAAPSTIEVPFTVTPPVSRIDPGKAQTLRIIYTGEPLPQDRESVFWLNVLEVPPKPAASEAEANFLQMAFRSRIKLFFRPAGLKGRADEAAAQVIWRLTQAGEAGKAQAALEARNPTAYHVSFGVLELVGGGKTATFSKGGMVGPGETKVFPLTGEVPTISQAKVNYQAINDYGGPLNGQAPLSAAPTVPNSAATGK